MNSDRRGQRPPNVSSGEEGEVPAGPERASQHPHLYHRQRMRERFLKNGASGFAPHELLELLLFGVIPYRDTNELAHRLLDRYGNLFNLCNAPYEDLLKVDGVGPSAAAMLKSLPAVFTLYMSGSGESRPCLNTTAKAAKYLTPHLDFLNHEEFHVLCLDSSLCLIRHERMFVGTLNRASIHPRPFIELMASCDMSGMVLAHNHPSGALFPSAEDDAVTAYLFQLLGCARVFLAEHLIIKGQQFYSYKQAGKIDRIREDFPFPEQVAEQAEEFKLE